MFTIEIFRNVGNNLGKINLIFFNSFELEFVRGNKKYD